MITTTPPSIHRLQLRLSSTIPLMFIAALLVFANSVPRLSGDVIGGGWRHFQSRGYGWPILFHVIDSVDLKTGASYPSSSLPLGQGIGSAVMDLVVALAILFACAALLGRTPRWRKVRKQ